MKKRVNKYKLTYLECIESNTLAKVSDRNSFRLNQNNSDICIRSNANHSVPIRKTFCNLFKGKG